MRTRAWKRPPAVRLRVPEREITVIDAFQGEVRQNVARSVGDFVLQRGDGVYAYQLAVVVDDLAMHITEVVRGADLLDSVPRQVLLAQLLGGQPPSFAHLPMITDIDGVALHKRNPKHTVRGLRALGRAPFELLASVGRALGILKTGTPNDSAPGQDWMPHSIDWRALANRRCVSVMDPRRCALR
jgi:glutamyl-tRNA synthetase